MNKGTPTPDSITRGASGTIEWAICELCTGRITRAVGSRRSWWHLETKRISCAEERKT